MELIKQSYEIIEPDYGHINEIEDRESQIHELLKIAYQQVEVCARNCYGSQARIEENSCWEFVQQLRNSKHFPPLEMGAIYLKYDTRKLLIKEWKHLHEYELNKYSKFVRIRDTIYITTTLRVIVENGWEADFDHICVPTKHHIHRRTVKLKCCIHTYKDLTRHRLASWCIESTRFINYLREKFGSSVSFIEPSWLKEEDKEEFENDCKQLEELYFKWINKGYKAQQAAFFLCQGTAATAYMCMYEDDWVHVFNLRTSIIHETGMPLPQVYELMDPLYNDFIEKGWIPTSSFK